MSDDIKEAERAVEAARMRVTANIEELKGWLGGQLPSKVQLKDGEQEAKARDDLALVFGKTISLLRANPAPALLMAIGAGWLMQRHLKPSKLRRRRVRKDKPREEVREPKVERETETFVEF